MILFGFAMQTKTRPWRHIKISKQKNHGFFWEKTATPKSKTKTPLHRETETINSRHRVSKVFFQRTKSHDIEIPRLKNHDIEIPRPKSHGFEFLWNSDPYVIWYRMEIKTLLRWPTSSPVLLFAIKGRWKRGPGTFQTRD